MAESARSVGHVAIAVDTERGLMAPVIHHADQLPLAQIAERSRHLIELARAGRLSQSQLQGGTLTVSNLGMFGVDGLTPLLNLPQAGILGIGRIVEALVVHDGELAAGRTLTLNLTFDHRVIDGAPAARWLQHLTRLPLAPEVALSDADQSAGLNLSSTGT